MKIKKTVTDKVIAANRENGKKGTGAKTQKGKDIVSQNAVRHGILALKFPFRSDEEKAGYDKLISDLKRKTIDRHDPLQRIVAEEFATACIRRGRALRLEQKLCEQQNPATEIVLKTIENSELMNTGIFVPSPGSGWDCTELTMGAKKEHERQLRNGALTNNTGNGEQLQLQAKFQDPMDKALRYQRATARDFYRALDVLDELRRKPKPKK